MILALFLPETPTGAPVRYTISLQTFIGKSKRKRNAKAIGNDNVDNVWMQNVDLATVAETAAARPSVRVSLGWE